MTTYARLDPIETAIGLLRKQEDPLARLPAIRALRAELAAHDERLDDLLRQTVLEARSQTPPATWAEIGALLNVSMQRAYQLADEYLGKKIAEAKK